MAESEGKSSTIVPWGALLALFTAVAGLVALLPSRSVRPLAPAETARSYDPNLELKVSARLWQDPLSVINDFATRARDDKANLPDSDALEEHRARVQEFARNSIVLVACEPSSPYAEDVERRVRDRVGIIQALASEGYIPEDSNALSYFNFKTEVDPNYLAYERFDSLKHQGKSVLVLWLIDDALEPRGLLYQLKEVAAQLNPDYWRKPDAALDLRVLGPSSSKQYRLLLENFTESDSHLLAQPLANTHIFSCKASAPDHDLWEGFSELEECAKSALQEKEPPARQNPLNGWTEKGVEWRMRKSGSRQFCLDRTICSDDVLATALWNELDLRHIHRSAHVAVVAELDTFYGRITTDAFLRACPSLHPRPDFLTQPNSLSWKELCAALPNVHPYFYLAGLDGALPKNALGDGEQKTKDFSRADQSPITEDPSEGQSQVDYFRRLANGLADKDRELNAGDEHLGAVAVLGSDIYDKLQVLRTLRPRLPDALFLTNNLDARFGHPDEWEETRNLLVASNYDLKPRKSWHSEVPPFRDSMQAAVYAAARMAFQVPEGEGSEAKKEQGPKERWMGRPMRFEIGRGGPVCLNPGIYEERGSEEPSVYKAPPAMFCLLLVLSLGWFLWPNASARARPDRPGLSLPLEPSLPALDSRSSGLERLCRALSSRGAAIPTALGMSFALTVGRYMMQASDQGEPFALLDGISIWPGDFLRLGILFLTVHFTARILYDLRRNLHEIEVKFALARPDEGERGFQARSSWIRHWRDFWPRREPYLDENHLVCVWHWWSRYKRWGNSWRRIFRALSLFALYWMAISLFCSAVSELFPVPPVRGPAWYLSTLILWAAGMSSLLVTFLVVDATELNWRSIRDLNELRTNWHLDTVKERSSQFGFKSHHALLEDEDCSDYLDIELIASRSNVVNGLIYYPFILLTLTLAARLRMTDDYQWPPSLFIVLSANTAWSLYCAIRLPLEARKARQTSLERLREKLFVRQIMESKGHAFDKSGVKALELVIQQIEDLKRGAFVGIWEQPVLRAVLVPSTSAGIWTLLGLLSR